MGAGTMEPYPKRRRTAAKNDRSFARSESLPSRKAQHLCVIKAQLLKGLSKVETSGDRCDCVCAGQLLCDPDGDLSDCNFALFVSNQVSSHSVKPEEWYFFGNIVESAPGDQETFSDNVIGSVRPDPP